LARWIRAISLFGADAFAPLPAPPQANAPIDEQKTIKSVRRTTPPPYST
jgi:hypothetical protein